MTAALRVLYLAPSSPNPGLLSRYSFLDEEIRALADRGIDVYVLSRADTDDFDEGRLHVRVVPPDSPRERRRTLSFLARHLRRVPPANLADPQQCYRAIRVERFAAEVIARDGVSLIHSYFGWPRGFGGLLAAGATGRPLVAGIRGSDINTLPALGYGTRLDPSFDRAVRRLLRAADQTVFVSEFLRRQGLALGARPEASRVILKGVRLDRFAVSQDRETARRAVGVGSLPMILAVAGLIPIKGLNYVLDALALVKSSGRTFNFVACGEGPEREALESQAQQLGLSPVCAFPGKITRSEIATYFAAADLLVHGSVIEASGNVLLEGMASGLPIVCTDAGGPAEYVRDGETGFVVPVADSAAMADRIAKLFDDPSLRKRLGDQGRELAEASFAYDRMIDETIEVYRSVLAR